MNLDTLKAQEKQLKEDIRATLTGDAKYQALLVVNREKSKRGEPTEDTRKELTALTEELVGGKIRQRTEVLKAIELETKVAMAFQSDMTLEELEQEISKLLRDREQVSEALRRLTARRDVLKAAEVLTPAQVAAARVISAEGIKSGEQFGKP